MTTLILLCVLSLLGVNLYLCWRVHCLYSYLLENTIPQTAPPVEPLQTGAVDLPEDFDELHNSTDSLEEIEWQHEKNRELERKRRDLTRMI